MPMLFCGCQSTPKEEEHKDFSFWPLTASAVTIADSLTKTNAGTGSQGYASLQRYINELDSLARRCRDEHKRHGLPAAAADWFAGSPELGKLPPPAEEYRETFPWLISVLAAPDLPDLWKEPMEAHGLLHRQQEKLAAVLDHIAALDSGSGDLANTLIIFRTYLSMQGESRALQKHLSKEVLEPGEKAEKAISDCLKATEGLTPFFAFNPLWQISATPVPKPDAEDSDKPDKPTAIRLLADPDSFALEQTTFLAQSFDWPEMATVREIHLILPPLPNGEVFLNGHKLPASANYSAVNITSELIPGQTQWLSFRISQRLTKAMTLPWLAAGKKLEK
jgi:hypothetical protein